MASRALWALSPLPSSPSLLSSPIFSTRLHLSHAHHFFNSSDSTGSFSPQGLCVYTLYFLESCSLHSQAPILKPGCFLLIISGFTKLFSFQWGHPWHSKLVAGNIFFPPLKGQISNIFTFAGQKVSVSLTWLCPCSVKAAINKQKWVSMAVSWWNFIYTNRQQARADVCQTLLSSKEDNTCCSKFSCSNLLFFFF